MTTQGEVLVTMRDVRAAGMCSRGVRVFCRRHGIDWVEFLQRGIPASRVLATGDAMAKQVVEAAYGRK